MANPCPNIGTGLAILAAAGILFTVASKHWKQNSQISSENFVMGIQSYEGLWVRCTSPQPGVFTCDQYDVSFLGLSSYLQALRAMMCLSAIAAAAGVVAGLLGLECVSAMEESRMKTWTGRSGGILMLLAGLLCLTAVSWYAADVIIKFTQNTLNTNNVFVYEFGVALYIGWVSAFFAILSGILLTCCNCGATDDTRMASSYTYKPPQPARRSTEYV